ncbi:hypothetical protein BCV71DRAFT_239593 [Rhizopus microsporus]|uniref:Uncharacterized protein n=1 Tax=Rhizopus microsporus TaxID=58291 RepID=A0A1X0RM06_RHIZD|nr:hypothetical protein BCV71DRAFT_239593 [Rhizopus microsporus]
MSSPVAPLYPPRRNRVNPSDNMMLERLYVYKRESLPKNSPSVHVEKKDDFVLMYTSQLKFLIDYATYFSKERVSCLSICFLGAQISWSVAPSGRELLSFNLNVYRLFGLYHDVTNFAIKTKAEVLFAASENTSSNRRYIVRSAHFPLPYCFTDKSAMANGTMMK